MGKAEAPKPEASIRIDFYASHVEVDIKHFEKLTPGRIQLSYGKIMEAWAQEQRLAVFERKGPDFEKQLNGASNADERRIGQNQES